MRRLAAPIAIVVVLLGETARAGEHHQGASLACADCHIMHGADDTATPARVAGLAGKAYLLRAGRSDDGLAITRTCLLCHDGHGDAPDVWGEHAGTYVRQAGALPTGAAPYDGWKGHSLDGRVADAPGGGGRMLLQCTSCHAEHGNTGYRNLGTNDAPAVSYAKGDNDLGKDVFVRSFQRGEVATNYAVDNVDFNEPRRASAMDAFCARCHPRMHGAPGDPDIGGGVVGAFLRHPTGGVDIGRRAGDGAHSSLGVFGGRRRRLKVASPSGTWGEPGAEWRSPARDLSPMCVSCHKAHGNRNAFGLILLSGQGDLTEEGDHAGVSAGPSALCGQCHQA